MNKEMTKLVIIKYCVHRNYTSVNIQNAISYILGCQPLTVS